MIGIDACRGGWVMAHFDGTAGQLQYFPNLSKLAKHLPVTGSVWIDMVIGLDNSPQGRICDREARAMLASARRSSSIFSPPCRAALYADAHQIQGINQQITGKKLSIQTINILPRIQEVDVFLQALAPHERLRWHEAHPEIVFTGLNGGQVPQWPKKTQEGHALRMDILAQYGSALPQRIEDFCKKHPRKLLLPDDAADALALAVAAYLYEQNPGCQRQLPAHPAPQDPAGLPMQMLWAFVQRGEN